MTSVGSVNITIRTQRGEQRSHSTQPESPSGATRASSAIHRMVSPYSTSYTPPTQPAFSSFSAASLGALHSHSQPRRSNDDSDAVSVSSRATAHVGLDAEAVRAESMALSYKEFTRLAQQPPQHSNSINNNSDDGSDTEGLTATPTASTFVDTQYPVEDPSRDTMLGNERAALLGDAATAKKHKPENLLTVLTSLPAASLGLLLMVLDSVSYGIIVFPAKSHFIPSNAPQVGVQMFLISSLISQTVFTIMSGFPGAQASMQIEVMPFLYLIVASIESQMASGDQASVVATIMVAFSMSTIMTGIVFFLLAHFKLGNMVQFFPRQVLIGCIGGIGWFLMVTGVEITSHLKPELTFDFIEQLFQPSKFMLWGTSLGLAFLLKLIQRKVSTPLLVPAFYTAVPIVFYIIVLLCGVPLKTLRDIGFLFNMEGGTLPVLTIYSYFNGFKGIDWLAVIKTLPIQFSLVFFALLHVPINIPALGVSTGHAYDMNNELFSHGVSNTVAGICGVPQNYLVYSNSLLVMRCGGETRSAGWIVSAGTLALWLVGGNIILFVPTILIGCLIFHLGIDLLLESLVDTLHMPISRLEYSTVLGMVVVMGVLGFTEGILLGICLALLFFVVEYSKESVILETFDGKVSNVRRSLEIQEFLEGVSGSVHGIRAYGFLFFGVISQIETHLEKVIYGEDGGRVKYVVLDCSLVKGVDFSALQGFERLKDLTAGDGIQLIFCSMGKLAIPISRSGIFSDDNSSYLPVLQFETTQIALEYCENEILQQNARWIIARKQQRMAKQLSAPSSSLLQSEGNILVDIFQSQLPSGVLGAKGDVFLSHVIKRYFSLVMFSKGEVVWQVGDLADSLVVVESGSFLRCPDVVSVVGDAGREKGVRTYLPGSMVGEVELFAGTKRMTRLIATMDDSTGWRMKRADFQHLCSEYPEFGIPFMQICLKYSKQ
ncbi:hypothetical protein HDU98_009069 [Podochytrium sp. JEL0797]|nr:hypothetical protein HDU98_009069 [Podochytrium sp. JEL0797]